MCDEWFETNATFLMYILFRPLLMPPGLTDNPTVRAIAVFLKYGVAIAVKVCPVCCARTKLLLRRTTEWTKYSWICATGGVKHFETQVNSQGSLTSVPINSWMPFLQLINMLRIGDSWGKIQAELQSGYGATKDALLPWRRLFQKALYATLKSSGSLRIGGKNIVVVCDETVVGVDKADGWSTYSRGVSKRGNPQIRINRQNQTRKLVRQKVLKRLPARTVYRTQTVQKGSHILKETQKAKIQRINYCMKRPSGTNSTPIKKQGKTQWNLKNAGRWLWLAVEVGRGASVYTHGNGRKRLTFRVLPVKSIALRGKPRGLAEIKATLSERILKGSFIVHDAWTSTTSAVKALGYESVPPVKHRTTFRSTESGFHTNDVESENNRLKSWNRQRYGKLQLDEDELSEYTYYVNLGHGIGTVLRGFATAAGGCAANPPL